MESVSKWQRFRGFLGECLRVIKVTRKPDTLEFKTIVKVSGLGILVIGVIGFLFFMMKQAFFP